MPIQRSDLRWAGNDRYAFLRPAMGARRRTLPSSAHLDNGVHCGQALRGRFGLANLWLFGWICLRSEEKHEVLRGVDANKNGLRL